MELKNIEQELEKLKSNLRAETNKYTEAISKKDRAVMESCEGKLNKLLEEIKIKTMVYEDLLKGKN